MRRSLPVFLLMLAAAAVVWVSGTALERSAAERKESGQLLYLPNGKYLKLVSLGQSQVLADLIYLWSIQFYSDYEREDRFRYVEHVFGDVIAELDPHYVDPYWLGAMILTVEAKDLEAGLKLLELGFRKNPGQWILPYLAGWECYLAGQTDRAVPYFEAAARTPGAPMVARRMHASLLSRVGDPQTALQLWSEVLEDPQADRVSLVIAKRKVRELRVQIDLQVLRRAIARFRSENRRWPRALEELRARGYIASVPHDPDDQAYAYDARTGEVSSRAGRVLGDA